MKHTRKIPQLLGLVVLSLGAACVSPEAHRRVVGANAQLQAQNAQMQEAMKQLAMENDRLRAEVDDLGKRAADASWIEQKKKEIADLLARYNGNSPTSIPGVDVIRTPEGYAFRLAGEVLFSPGRNDLSDLGKKTLGDLTKEFTGHRIRVEGHTDDTPIVHSQWGTNLRLSAERAMAVADFLIKSGVEAKKVSIAGYGEYRPALDGSDDAARLKNRRVEILLLKD